MGPIVQHLWTFEDGTFSYDANPTKIFPAPGRYRARVTVTDNSGNTAAGSVTVNVTTTFDQWRAAKFQRT
jgi:microbial collagenase